MTIVNNIAHLIATHKFYITINVGGEKKARLAIDWDSLDETDTTKFFPVWRINFVKDDDSDTPKINLDVLWDETQREYSEYLEAHRSQIVHIWTHEPDNPKKNMFCNMLTWVDCPANEFVKDCVSTFRVTSAVTVLEVGDLDGPYVWAEIHDFDGESVYEYVKADALTLLPFDEEE